MQSAPSGRRGVAPAVHVLVHLLRHLLRVTEVRRGHSHLHYDADVVHFDGLEGTIFIHVAHFFSDDSGNHIVDLLHVQRADGRDVADATLPDHCLCKLHLRRDVGHLHGVIVIVGDVQSIRNVEIDAPPVLVVAHVHRFHPDIGHIYGSWEEEEDRQAGQQQTHRH